MFVHRSMDGTEENETAVAATSAAPMQRIKIVGIGGAPTTRRSAPAVLPDDVVELRGAICVVELRVAICGAVGRECRNYGTRPSPIGSRESSGGE